VRDHPDQFERGAHLRDRLHELGAQFLLTELQAGLALLDVADTSVSDEASERRRALALETYEVVPDRLARTPNVVPLTDEERALIIQLHRGAREAPRP
jgi:hypothetical protein